MYKRIIPVMMLMFVNTLGFTLLLPVLPFIIRDYGQSDAVYGLLLSLYAAFVFVGSPILGNLSDKYGRKPILIISQAGTLLSWVIFGLAWFMDGSTWPILIIALSRVTDGITGGNVSVANAYLSDITTPEERTQAFTYLVVASGTALLIGPSIGGFSNATSIDYLGTAIVAVLISTVTLLSIIFQLKESLPPEERTTEININPLYQLNMLAKIRNLGNSRPIQRMFVLRMFFSFGLQAYVSIIVLYVIDLFQFNEQQLGFFLLFIGSFLIFNQLVAFPFFAKRFDDLTILIIGFILMSIGLFLLPIFESMLLYLLCYYVLNLGLSLGFPTLKSLLSKLSDRKQQGVVMGIDEALIALMGAIAPAIAGALYAEIRWITFLLIGAFLLIGLTLSLSSRDMINQNLQPVPPPT
ncbi:MAG: MFS transporter [Ardenticatenaceae bacterium]